jgi:hemerythrin superfamily protein
MRSYRQRVAKQDYKQNEAISMQHKTAETLEKQEIDRYQAWRINEDRQAQEHYLFSLNKSKENFQNQLNLQLSIRRQSLQPK